MKKTPLNGRGSYQRVIFTLPRKVVGHVRSYARAVRGGNKSGFVADAIEAYVSYLRKAAHTRKMRASYAAAASDSRAIAELWQPLDDEAWAKLDG